MRKTLTAEQFPKAAKTMIGGLIWLLQTRFDISYWVVFLATSIEPVILDRSLLPEFLKNCDRAKKVLFPEDIAVWYHPFVPQSETRRPQLIAYADAGYATLSNSASVESFMVCYGVPIGRDGVIKLQANAVAWQARGIKKGGEIALSRGGCRPIDCNRFHLLVARCIY